MLVLKRKIGESIIVGERIEVMVTSIQQGAARIGIDAPGLSIRRKEVPREAPETPLARYIGDAQQAVVSEQRVKDAASDLLEACRVALFGFDESVKLRGNLVNGYEHTAINRLKKAIAKAEGTVPNA